MNITRVFPNPPYSRSAVCMQAMARRGERLNARLRLHFYARLWRYTPNIGDLRLGSVEVKFTHPLTQKEVIIGEIEVSAVECVGEVGKAV